MSDTVDKRECPAPPAPNTLGTKWQAYAERVERERNENERALMAHIANEKNLRDAAVARAEKAEAEVERLREVLREILDARDDLNGNEPEVGTVDRYIEALNAARSALSGERG